jgi:AGCS family alanine or glycine:cation symporter
MLQLFEQVTATFSAWAWGYHLLFLLIGGGIFFTFYSNFIPFRYWGHTLGILRGKYDDDHHSPGDISHFQALSSAIAATVGMGNISGVAVAIDVGGPGALFWMWVSAVLGMSIKFFDCTLAVMYRGKDSAGNIQGGPMYVIVEALGNKWRPMAMFFAAAGLIGLLPMFQANQLTQVIREVILIPNGWVAKGSDYFIPNLLTAAALIFLVSFVIFGGIQRIADAASKLVPAMVLLYVVSVLFIIFSNFSAVPDAFGLIFTDAFSGGFVAADKKDEFFGGVLGYMIITGIKRAAFSNEAGIGTAPLAHGAARTQEPVREGLVAMLGPVIDTLVVCTMTALAIIVTGTWKTTVGDGVSITVEAFEYSMPGYGRYVLIVSAFIFAITTLFTYSYYGTKCFGFLFGAQRQHWYNYFYVSSIVLGAVASIGSVINLIDGAYALMALPNMLVTLMLAPKVRRAAKDYFQRMGLAKK